MEGIAMPGTLQPVPMAKLVDFVRSRAHQISAMVLLLSPERLELGSCACAHIEALKEGNGSFYPDDAGNPSEKERNVANRSVKVVAFFALFLKLFP